MAICASDYFVRQLQRSLWVGICFCMWIIHPVVIAQPLPQQVGTINDYAAILGGKPQRQPLKQRIVQLKEAYDVSLTVLVSERDPFNDLTRYAAEIRRAWSVPNDQTAFALFLKVDGRWQLDVWLGKDLMTLSALGDFQSFQSQLQTLTRRGRIRQAALQVADGLLALLDQPPPSVPSNKDSFPWGVTGGGVLGLLGVTWHWLRSYCPDCVCRLKRTRRSGKTLKHCTHCGYNR